MMFGGANVWAPPVLRPAPVIGGPRPAATWWDQYSNQLTLPTQVITEINSASTQIVGFQWSAQFNLVRRLP